MAIRIASLFTGVGGAEIGFSRAFGEQNIQHVAFAEYDKFASQVLASRFPGVPNFGDVTKIDWASFPKCDILHASPPCQAFSVAGRQKGMDDDRGLPMWNAYFKCLEAVKPPIITLEEVPAVASKKFAKEWAWILSEWARLGYYVKFTKIQALDHGVPQSRLRLIVVGFLNKARCDAFEWPEPQPRTKKLKDILEPEDEVDAKYYLKAEGILKLLGKMNDEQVGRLLGLASPAGELINHGTVVPQEEGHANCIDGNYAKGPDNHGQRTVVAIISQPHGNFPGSVDADKVGTLRKVTPDNQRVAIVHPVTFKEMDHANTLRSEDDCALDAKHVNRHVGVVKCVNRPAGQDERVYDPEGVSPTLASNRGGGSSKSPYIICQGGDGKPCVMIKLLDTKDNKANNEVYAKPQTERPNQKVPPLRKASDTQMVPRKGEVGRPNDLRQSSLLRLEMLQRADTSSVEDEKSKLDTSSLQGKSHLQEKGSVRALPCQETDGSSPQGREPLEQRIEQSTGDLPGLPHETTSKDCRVPGAKLPEPPEGSGILREALPEVQEVGEPTGVQGEPVYACLFIRRLTVVETSRLMGWPDDWNAEVSNSQRYRQCGNGLVSNVIAALAPTLTP